MHYLIVLAETAQKSVPCNKQSWQDSEQNTTPSRELNIPLLGETGVGNSTWIIGFANYLSYPTLEETESSETITLIPISFTLTCEDGLQKNITLGTRNKNENSQTTESCTHFLKHIPSCMVT